MGMLSSSLHTNVIEDAGDIHCQSNRDKVRVTGQVQITLTGHCVRTSVPSYKG